MKFLDYTCSVKGEVAKISDSYVNFGLWFVRRRPQIVVGGRPFFEFPFLSGPIFTMTENFFQEQTEQSQIKAKIVSEYFWSWGKVITGYQKREKKKTKISYIDLFSGPGRYENGSVSTPLMILERAIEDELFRSSLVTLFNDASEKSSSNLQEEIDKIAGVKDLAYKPQVCCEEVGEEIVKAFDSLNFCPTLMFVDPWGYKGLSLQLINSVLKDWACECIFFFNYNRINMGLSNPAVKKHMVALFGEERADALMEELKGLSPDDRESMIVERICEALIEMGGKYVLPFRFRNKKGTRTSHHLIFVSKHPLGYKIMKQVMANESTGAKEGVPTFEYNPATKKFPVLFNLTRTLDELEGMLLEQYAGKSLTMGQLFEDHNYGLPYIPRNYKEVMLNMEIAGTITTDRPYTTRRIVKGQYTFADNVRVTFPK